MTMEREIDKHMKEGITMAELVQVESRGLQQVQDLGGMMQSYISYIDRTEATTRTYIINLRQWAAWLSFKGISRPGREDVISYREWLVHEHDAIQLDGGGWSYRTDGNGCRVTLTCRPATAAIYIRTVKGFYRWTETEGLYPDIGKDVRVPKVTGHSDRERLKAAEVVQIEGSIKEQATDKVLAAAQQRKDTAGRMERATLQGKRLYAMYLLTVCCGLRTIELHRANVGDLSVRDGSAWIMVYGKGHTAADQQQAVPAEVYDALQDYLQARTGSYTKSSPLFVSTGNRSGGQRIATTTISTMLKRAMQQAGYDDERLTAHSLRHSATSAAYNATGNLYQAQQYARHASPVTTEIYIHEDDEQQQKQATARAVYDYYHGSTAAQQPVNLQDLSTEELLAELARRVEKRAG